MIIDVVSAILQDFDKCEAGELHHELKMYNNELPCPDCGGPDFCRKWAAEGWIPYD